MAELPGNPPVSGTVDPVSARRNSLVSLPEFALPPFGNPCGSTVGAHVAPSGGEPRAIADVSELKGGSGANFGTFSFGNHGADQSSVKGGDGYHYYGDGASSSPSRIRPKIDFSKIFVRAAAADRSEVLPAGAGGGIVQPLTPAPATPGALLPYSDRSLYTARPRDDGTGESLESRRWWHPARVNNASQHARSEIPAVPPPTKPRGRCRRGGARPRRRRAVSDEDDFRTTLSSSTGYNTDFSSGGRHLTPSNAALYEYYMAAAKRIAKRRGGRYHEGPLMAAIAAQRRHEEEAAAASVAAAQAAARAFPGAPASPGTVQNGAPRAFPPTTGQASPPPLLHPAFNSPAPPQYSMQPNRYLAAPPLASAAMFAPAQPGVAVASDALSPVASRSLLTCSKDFQHQFPNVYAGLCKGLLDVNRLIQHEVVIPIREEVSLHKDALRCRRSVTAAVSEQLFLPLRGRFPDPNIGPKLVKRLCEYFFAKIEQGIQEAEEERTFIQWLFRLDVENGLPVRVTTSLGCGLNSTIANIEGRMHVKRRKGTALSIIQTDSIVLDLDLVIRALFLNGGQLAEINNDPIFIDRIQAGANPFAATLIGATLHQ